MAAHGVVPRTIAEDAMHHDYCVLCHGDCSPLTGRSMRIIRITSGAICQSRMIPELGHSMQAIRGKPR